MTYTFTVGSYSDLQTDIDTVSDQFAEVDVTLTGDITASDGLASLNLKYEYLLIDGQGHTLSTGTGGLDFGGWYPSVGLTNITVETGGVSHTNTTWLGLNDNAVIEGDLDVESLLIVTSDTASVTGAIHLVGSGEISFEKAGTLTYGGDIDGTGSIESFISGGSATTILTGDVSFTGGASAMFGSSLIFQTDASRVTGGYNFFGGTLEFDAAHDETISSFLDTSYYFNFPGTVSTLVVAGPGTVTLSNNANDFSGSLDLNGHLKLTANNAAGASTIVFGSNASLTLAAGVSISNEISGFAAGDTIDLAGFDADTTQVSVSGTTVTITDGMSHSETLTIDGADSDTFVTSASADGVAIGLPAPFVDTLPALTGTQATLAAGTEDTAYTIHASDLLQGFTDTDGDTLSVTGLSANHGTISVVDGSTFQLTPEADYFGTVTLSYTVSDGHAGGTLAATETLSLTEVPDTIYSPVTYTLGAYVENLVLIGTDNIDGTGNAVDNVITGNSGNNHLDGGAGADTMVGGLGDDTYYVDNIGDVVTENANEGTDTVVSSITYVLGTNVENLILSGSSAINGSGNTANNVITGNAGDNNLVGNFGDDVLDGKGGVNFLYGDWGNDTYIVNSVNDHVSELYNGADTGGTDTVMSSITYGLGAYIENLTLTGSAAINGSGNELNNVLTGNSGDNQLAGNAGNDVLNGGAGVNYLYGGSGDDTYYVNSTTDHALEVQAGVDQGGNDTVISSINYALPLDIENLILSGSANLNGSGNTQDNHITGNSGDNQLAGLGGDDVLDGGAGVNWLYGGAGNDTYIVNSVNDHPDEQTVAGVDDGGIDTVISSITYKLCAYVENLTLAGSSNINATGNYLDNVITGNSGNNILEGRLGNDTFVFGSAATNGLDHLTDFTSGSDKLEFHAADYGFAASHVMTSSEISFTGAAVGTNAQFVYDTTTHTLSWDANGSAAGGVTQLVIFDNGAMPTTADFLFV